MFGSNDVSKPTFGTGLGNAGLNDDAPPSKIIELATSFLQIHARRQNNDSFKMANPGKSKHRRFYLIFAFIVLIPVLFLAATSLFSSKPENLGVVQGRLAACPSSPNCVSTQATDDEHRIEPIEFSGSSDEAIQTIKAALGKFSGIKIASEDKNYLHAEATSFVFRFVDDIEFFVDESNGLIHFRSASRSGHSDFGANRKRMEKFRAAFEQSIK